MSILVFFYLYLLLLFITPNGSTYISYRMNSTIKINVNKAKCKRIIKNLKIDKTQQAHTMLNMNDRHIQAFCFMFGRGTVTAIHQQFKQEVIYLFIYLLRQCVLVCVHFCVFARASLCAARVMLNVLRVHY